MQTNSNIKKLAHKSAKLPKIKHFYVFMLSLRIALQNIGMLNFY